MSAFTHESSFDLPADPARVFRALVQPEELTRWFARHVVVEPHVGGAYHFWGPATLGNPGAGAQKLSAYEPASRLAYRWTVLDVPSEVTLGLAPGAEEGQTKLTISHEIAGALPFSRPDHAIDDLWRLHVGNLVDHLLGGTPVLPDFTSDKPEVRVVLELDAPPAKVFRALVEPELMARWLWNARPTVDGSAYSYGWDHGPTKILERIENQLLVTDWTDWRGVPDKTTRVSWRLEPLAGGTRTRLTLVHDGFQHAVDRSDYQQGWAGFAEALGQVAASV